MANGKTCEKLKTKGRGRNGWWPEKDMFLFLIGRKLGGRSGSLGTGAVVPAMCEIHRIHVKVKGEYHLHRVVPDALHACVHTHARARASKGLEILLHV